MKIINIKLKLKKLNKFLDYIKEYGKDIVPMDVLNSMGMLSLMIGNYEYNRL